MKFKTQTRIGFSGLGEAHTGALQSRQEGRDLAGSAASSSFPSSALAFCRRWVCSVIVLNCMVAISHLWLSSKESEAEDLN